MCTICLLVYLGFTGLLTTSTLHHGRLGATTMTLTIKPSCAVARCVRVGGLFCCRVRVRVTC